MSKAAKVIARTLIVLFVIAIFGFLTVVIVQSNTNPVFETSRFVELSSDMNTYSGAKIIVDKETGIQYLWVVRGYHGGLTPLLGSDGQATYYSGDLGE